MKIKAADFFTSEDKELIKRAIEKAESNTSGEIAIMVVDQSDSYREAAALGGVIVSGLLSLVLEIMIVILMNPNQLWDNGSWWSPVQLISAVKDALVIWYYIPLVFLLYFPCRYLLMKLPGFRIRFMSRRGIEEIVSERAIRAFYEKGLYKTRDETGILIFISLLERTVWILGDRGINSKISAEFWRERAHELTKGIREKSHTRAVTEVITRCGEELAKFFPRKPDDTNELTDEVLL
jgi:putative membrane protein